MDYEQWKQITDTIIKVTEGGTTVMGFLNSYVFSNVVPVAEVFKKVIEFIIDFFKGGTFNSVVDFFANLFSGEVGIGDLFKGLFGG